MLQTGNSDVVYNTTLLYGKRFLFEHFTHIARTLTFLAVGVMCLSAKIFCLSSRYVG